VGPLFLWCSDFGIYDADHLPLFLDRSYVGIQAGDVLRALQFLRGRVDTAGLPVRLVVGVLPNCSACCHCACPRPHLSAMGDHGSLGAFTEYFKPFCTSPYIASRRFPCPVTPVTWPVVSSPPFSSVCSVHWRGPHARGPHARGPHAENNLHSAVLHALAAGPGIVGGVAGVALVGCISEYASVASQRYYAMPHWMEMVRWLESVGGLVGVERCIPSVHVGLFAAASCKAAGRSMCLPISLYPALCTHQ
jgi:hypothetical protein